MKQVICLPDGSRVEIEESNVKHIGKNENVQYDSTERILYGEEQLEALRERWRRERDNLPEAVKKDLENIRPLLEEDIES